MFVRNDSSNHQHIVGCWLLAAVHGKYNKSCSKERITYRCRVEGLHRNPARVEVRHHRVREHLARSEPQRAVSGGGKVKLKLSVLVRTERRRGPNGRQQRVDLLGRAKERPPQLHGPPEVEPAPGAVRKNNSF